MNSLSETLILLILGTVSVSIGTDLERLRCSNGNVTGLRILNCDLQPCTIRKGEAVPFEVDLVFEHHPTIPAEMNFKVLNPYYAVPPSTFGSYLARGDCQGGGLGFECPLTPGNSYTLKSGLYIEPKAVCTAACAGISENGTGLRVSSWDFYVTAPAHENMKSSFCSFDVTLNIVE